MKTLCINLVHNLDSQTGADEKEKCNMQMIESECTEKFQCTNVDLNVFLNNLAQTILFLKTTNMSKNLKIPIYWSFTLGMTISNNTQKYFWMIVLIFLNLKIFLDNIGCYWIFLTFWVIFCL